MQILGVSDGLDGGAALCVDDRLVASEPQAALDHTPHSRAFPWDAIDDVLRRAGSVPADIRTIAVAGRITPPFFLRRRPGLRKVLGGAFSSALDLGVFYQAMLRQTGLGALEADRAADWLAERFERRGFRGRLQMVDIHTALANVAYRTQDDDDLLLITLHPLGDGVSFAVHRANLGQIDRVFEQKGFSTLHVHLERCAHVLGFDDVPAMWAAVGPQSDPDLVAALESHLYLDHHKLSHARYPLPQDRAVYDLLGRADPAVGAASVRANLSKAVVALVRYHVRQHDRGRIAVAGEVFRERRLVADLAAIPEVESVYCPPEPGSACLAEGAALAAGGLGMSSYGAVAVDPDLPDGRRVEADEIADWLQHGQRVAFASGRSGGGHRGNRAVWTLEGPGVPASLGPPAELEPSVVEKLTPTLRAGSAMPRKAESLDRVDGVWVPRDGGLLAEVLEALGPEATVHLEPLQLSDAPVATMADIRAAAAHHRAGKLVLGRAEVPVP